MATRRRNECDREQPHRLRVPAGEDAMRDGSVLWISAVGIVFWLFAVSPLMRGATLVTAQHIVESLTPSFVTVSD